MIVRICRPLLVSIALAYALLPGFSVVGQENAEAEKGGAKVSLQVGDKAPPLNVDHWLGGGNVEAYSKDNVYLVEFWATWCGPCIKSMPHLSELAERYAKDGLVIVAMTKADEANTLEAVKQFVSGPGKEYAFRYAMCDGDATYNAFMEAAGQKAIPCSFVVDREGKIAYIGHPADLDYVLDRVLKGQWKGKEDAEILREMNESITKLAVLAQTDPDKALQVVEHIRRVNPQRAKSVDFAYVEVMVLCQKKLHDKAKDVVESFCSGSDKTVDWGGAALICGVLASQDQTPDGQYRAYALSKMKAAEEALKDDWQNLTQVSIAYQMMGDKVKFKECMDRVILLCPDEQVKKTLKMAMDMQLKGRE